MDALDAANAVLELSSWIGMPVILGFIGALGVATFLVIRQGHFWHKAYVITFWIVVFSTYALAASWLPKSEADYRRYVIGWLVSLSPFGFGAIGFALPLSLTQLQ